MYLYTPSSECNKICWYRLPTSMGLGILSPYKMSTLVERNKTWQKPANTIIKTDIYCKLAYKLLLLSIEINKHLNISSALDDIKILLHTVNLPSHPIFVQNVSSLTVHRHAGLHTGGFSLTTRWCSKIGLFTFALTHNYLLNRHFNPCL